MSGGIFPEYSPLPNGDMEKPKKPSIKDLVKPVFTGKKLTADEVYQDSTNTIAKIDGYLEDCENPKDRAELLRIRQSAVEFYSKLSNLLKEAEVLPVNPAVFVVVLPSGGQVNKSIESVKSEIVQ
jgi:hypothetical protein